jgi:hypothetical protein
MIEKITPVSQLSFTKIEHNSNGFRTNEFNTVDHLTKKFLTFGCSHTEGVAVLKHDSWPEQLRSNTELPQQLFNLGQGSASIDYVCRIMPYCLDYFQPDYVFLLCPNYLRFEYIDSAGVIRQSLPTDSNRINFVKTHDEEWCQQNYKEKLTQIKYLCNNKNIPNFYLKLDDLHSVIDHADRWILASDNMHYDKNWHRVIAEIFRYKFLARHLID